MTENGMVGCHYWLRGHEFEQMTPLVVSHQETTFANLSYGFSSSHVWMRELDHKES